MLSGGVRCYKYRREQGALLGICPKEARGMTEGLLLAGAVSLLAVGAANLVVAVIALRSARRYVDLAEARMERLRKDHVRILRFLREERRVLHAMISEAEDRGSELDEKKDAGRRIDRLKRELLAPAAARRHRVIDRESVGLSPEDPFEERGRSGKLPEREAPSKKKEARGKKPPPAGFPQTRRESTGRPDEKGSQRAVWHPHPDDDVSPGGTPAGRAGGVPAGASGDASVEIFRRHYDKYLENYEGYVKLAARIHRMRDGSRATPGSPAEHEWEERLRRVEDGIERTTARLDILEEYNPELATDDRISRRASIARAHSELERSS